MGMTVKHFSVEAKENQDKVPTLYWLPKLHKNHIKQDLLLILVLVQQQNFQISGCSVKRINYISLLIIRKRHHKVIIITKQE